MSYACIPIPITAILEKGSGHSPLEGISPFPPPDRLCLGNSFHPRPGGLSETGFPSDMCVHVLAVRKSWQKSGWHFSIYKGSWALHNGGEWHSHPQWQAHKSAWVKLVCPEASPQGEL